MPGFTYDQIDVRILALAAAVIRSDGKISDEEVRFVRKQFIGQFGQARAEKAFANYKTFTNKNSLEHICRELMFTTSYQSRQSILVFLFQVAASDGRISDEEVQLMARIAGWMGVAQQHFHYIYSAFAQGAYQRSGPQERGPKGASAVALRTRYWGSVQLRARPRSNSRTVFWSKNITPTVW